MLVAVLAAAIVARRMVPLRRRTDGPRLVVLYVACTVKDRYLQPYNGAVDYTPNLAAFAREAVVFRRHMTEAAQSGIAFASIFSGAQALRHGAFWHPVKLADDLYEIGEAFRDAGYDTFYWAGHPMAPAKLGYARGIRVTYPRSVRDIDGYTATDPDFAAILDHLRADPSYRAFVQIALTITHAPYDGNVTRKEVGTFMREHPAEAMGLSDADVDHFIQIYHDHVFDLQWDFDHTIAQLGLGEADVQTLARVVKLYYTASIHRFDAYFGKFVDQIRDAGLVGDSIIAFTADHGESMRVDHRLYHWTHGLQLTPGSLSVPWMISAPGRLTPHSYEGVTRSIDVYPTLAGLSGVHIPSGAPVDGTDLSQAVLERRPEPAIRAYFHTAALGSERYADMRTVEPIARFYPGPDVEWIWVGLREGDMVYKWRNLDGHEWGLQVFDLATDRGETRNLFNAEDPGQARMLERLLAYKRRLVKAHERLRTMPGQPTPEEMRRRLRQLGYIP